MTKPFSIETLRSKPEGQTFDRKSARIDAKALAVVLTAMANADGGSVVVGIEDDGIITGIDRYLPHINDLLRVPIDYCVPSIEAKAEYISCKNDEGNNDHVLLIHIEQSNRIHATTADNAYLRVGDKSYKLGFEERMQLTFAKGVCYFEDEPVSQAEMDDIDLNAVADYCDIIGYDRDAQTYLRTNKGFVVGKNQRELVSGAALLLFGKEPQRWFQRARVRVICFDGNVEQTGVRMNVVKDEMFEGRIVEMTRNVLAFVKTQIKEHTFLGEGAVFRTVPDYPEFCWTELIVNAIAHRDYSISGTDIQVKIFSDHLTVESPGILPGTVRLGNLRTTHFSRNPKIANVLHDYGFVREFGEGINRIYEEMAKAGLPAPEFKQSDFILRATIRKIVNTEKKSDGQSVVADRIDENVAQNVAQNDRRSAIIKCIKENPYISRAKIAYILGVSVKTVERDIAEMSDMISYIGSAKNGYWQINDNNDTKTENL